MCVDDQKSETRSFKPPEFVENYFLWRYGIANSIYRIELWWSAFCFDEKLPEEHFKQNSQPTNNEYGSSIDETVGRTYLPQAQKRSIKIRPFTKKEMTSQNEKREKTE